MVPVDGGAPELSLEDGVCIGTLALILETVVWVESVNHTDMVLPICKSDTPIVCAAGASVACGVVLSCGAFVA